MKLELPDNNASVLFHMGNALQSIAKDLGMDTHTRLSGELTKAIEEMKKSAPPILQPADVSGMTPDEISDTVDKMIESVAADWKVPVNRLTGNTTDAEQYGKSVLSDCLDSIDDLAESIGIVHQQASDATAEVSDTIDADGLPWDQRIHSGGKTRLTDNTWRMAKKPKDKSDEEWAEYVEGIKTELKALMAIPVATDAELDVLANIPVITPPVADVARIAVNGVVLQPVNKMPLADVDPFAIEPPVVDAVVAPPVVDAVVAPPVVDAVVAPPVVDAVVAPPVVDAVVTPPPADFGALMRFITANKAKLTSPAVDDVLAGQGLASLALLATRPELIPQFHAALVKLL